MPATETNQNFFELKPLWVGKVGAAGVASAVAPTIPLQSAAGLTNGNAYIITANRVTAGGAKNPANERETFIGKLSGTNFIDCVRQFEGEAQAWDADTVLEILVTAAVWNKLIEGIEAEHNPDGTHKLQKFDEARYAEDAESDDDYIVTLDPAPTEYYAGMVVNFKATTVNTGACTIDVNELGPQAIKTPEGANLTDAQIPAGSIVSLIYDGTNFILQSIGGLATKAYVDNTSKKILAAPDSDHTISGATIELTAAVNMAFGDVGYIASSGKVALIDADAIANMSGVVMCADNSIDGDASGNFLLLGIARDDTWNWTVGGLIYGTVTGTTGNTLSQTAPSGTDDVVQIMGVATHADRMLFKPSLVQIERV